MCVCVCVCVCVIDVTINTRISTNVISRLTISDQLMCLPALPHDKSGKHNSQAIQSIALALRVKHENVMQNVDVKLTCLLVELCDPI